MVGLLTLPIPGAGGIPGHGAFGQSCCPWARRCHWMQPTLPLHAVLWHAGSRSLQGRVGVVRRHSSQTWLPNSSHHPGAGMCPTTATRSQPHCADCLPHTHHQEHPMEQPRSSWKWAQEPCGQGTLSQVDGMGPWAARELYPEAGWAGLEVGWQEMDCSSAQGCSPTVTTL